MTIYYSRKASNTNFIAFHKLLLEFKGSIWKLLKTELFFWIESYLILNLIYHLLISGSSFEKNFISTVKILNTYLAIWRNLVIIVMGFYFRVITIRWRKIWLNMPWIDDIATSLAAFLTTNNQEDCFTRRSIIHHLMVSYTLVFREISPKILKRFPNLDDLPCDLITGEELNTLKKEEIVLKTMVPMMPIEWVLSRLKKENEKYRLPEKHMDYMIEKIWDFRRKLQQLEFHFLNIPLVYTQLVNWMVFIYFGMALLARQYLGLEYENDVNYRVNYSIPFFTIAEFLFLFGWLKISQMMLNPFGMDDDDFEIGFLMDRNLQVGLAIIDDWFKVHPILKEIDFSSYPIASDKEIEESNPAIGSVAIKKKLQMVAKLEKSFFDPEEKVDSPETPEFHYSSPEPEKNGFFPDAVEISTGQTPKFHHPVPAVNTLIKTDSLKSFNEN